MKKESSMAKLFAYAGKYKYFTISSWILSAVSALVGLLPFMYIWKIMKEVLEVAPNFKEAQMISQASEKEEDGFLVGGGFYLSDFVQYYKEPSAFTIENNTLEDVSITGAKKAIGSYIGYAYNNSKAINCKGEIKDVKSVGSTKEDLALKELR